MATQAEKSFGTHGFGLAPDATRKLTVKTGKAQCGAVQVAASILLKQIQVLPRGNNENADLALGITLAAWIHTIDRSHLTHPKETPRASTPGEAKGDLGQLPQQECHTPGQSKHQGCFEANAFLQEALDKSAEEAADLTLLMERTRLKTRKQFSGSLLRLWLIALHNPLTSKGPNPRKSITLTLPGKAKQQSAPLRHLAQ